MMKYMPAVSFCALVFVMLAIIGWTFKRINEQAVAVNECALKGGVMVQSIGHGPVCVQVGALIL